MKTTCRRWQGTTIRLILVLVVGYASLLGLAPASAVYAGSFTVTTLNDSGPGSLRQAILNANAQTGADTISFDVTGTIGLTQNLPTISDHLIIHGPGAKNLTITGNRNLFVFNVVTTTLELNDVTLANIDVNTAGGAITAYTSTLNIANTIFASNTGSFAGGIYAGDSTVTISNSTFSANNGDLAGGIMVAYDSTLTVANSTFSSNTSDLGAGGILVSTSSVMVSNTTFSSNTAGIGAGGIYAETATGTVSNSTFFSNSNAGSVADAFTVFDSTLAVQNTIIANTLAGPNCYGDGVTDNGGNLSSDNTCGFTNPASQNGVALALGPLQDNGGPTFTHALLAGSPALDKGVNCPSPATDQRGVARPQGIACDSGAFELEASQSSKLYAVENKDGKIQFYTINPATGAAVALGPKQTLDFEDVAVHPTTGVLYASTGGDGSKKGALYRIDTTSGAATLIGASGFADITVLKFRSDGTLWGWNEGKGLVQLSLTTGTGTLKYSKDMKIEGMAWTSSGTLYMARNKYLYEYNPTTGKTVEYAKNLPKGTEALDILPDGRLVGGARDGSKITLFTYNIVTKKVITTKTVTGGSSYTPQSIEGLSWPSTLTSPSGF